MQENDERIDTVSTYSVILYIHSVLKKQCTFIQGDLLRDPLLEILETMSLKNGMF